MANIKISELTLVTPASADEMVIVDSTDNASKRITVGSLPDTNTTYTAGTNVAISGSNVISSTDTNTTYSVGDGGLTTNDFTAADHSKLNAIEASADVTDSTNVVAALTAGTNVAIAGDGTISSTDTNTTYSAGSSSTLGLIKLEDDASQTTAASAITTTAARTYGLQINSSGQGVVNVPWVDTDTNTTYSVQDGELSQNNLTTTLKGNYDTGYSHSQSTHAPSGAEANAANTAITTADTSWTGSQRATLVVDNDGSFDMNLGQNFKCSVSSGSVTLTFGSIANGQSGFILLINSGATMLAYAGSGGSGATKVDASLLTTISTAGTYLISYLSDGSNVYLTNSAIYT